MNFSFPFSYSAFSYTIPMVFTFPVNHNLQSLELDQNHALELAQFKKQFSQSIKKAQEMTLNDKLIVLIERGIQKLHPMHYSKRKFKNCWSQGQDTLLRKLVSAGKLSWKQISKQFTNRTPIGCERRYQRLRKLSARELMFSNSTKLKLVGLIQEYGLNLQIIQLHMPQFTPQQLQEIYQRVVDPPRQKYVFSYAQDMKLMRLVLNYGEDWGLLQQLIEGRCSETLKNRYEKWLKPIEIQVKKEIRGQ